MVGKIKLLTCKESVVNEQIETAIIGGGHADLNMSDDTVSKKS